MIELSDWKNNKPGPEINILLETQLNEWLEDLFLEFKQFTKGSEFTYELSISDEYDNDTRVDLCSKGLYWFQLEILANSIFLNLCKRGIGTVRYLEFKTYIGKYRRRRFANHIIDTFYNWFEERNLIC